MAYAICAAIEGNFSWKYYLLLKSISVTTTIITTGISYYIPIIGSPSTAIEGMGLASKSAIAKAIGKQIVMELIQGCVDGMVRYSVRQLTDLLLNTLLNDIFETQFTKYIESSQYNKE